MNKQYNIIIGIIALVLFVSAHFLIGMYFNLLDRPLYFWVWSDIFLYMAIGLQIYLIVVRDTEKLKTN